MKFTFKVFAATISVMAIALGVSGFFLINAMFEAAVKRETRQAMNDHNMIQFALETIALNAPLKYEYLQDNTIEHIALALRSEQTFRVSGENKQVIYTDINPEASNSLLSEITETTQAYHIVPINGQYFIHAASGFEILGRWLYLETCKDISNIFEDRQTGFTLYRIVSLVTLFGVAVIMSLLSLWLTRPVRVLSHAAIAMAGGDYTIRAKRISRDELGLLTDDFNIMADALASKIKELKEAVESQERFVAAFAHELKTPLTSIVGYADLLRSCTLDEEKQFMAANYIYTEGKRLEKLSFRLMDIVVLKNGVIEANNVPVVYLFSLVGDMFSFKEGVKLRMDYDPAEVRVETSLFIAVLANLIENAIKASPSDKVGRVDVTGRVTEAGYRFSIRDEGCGISDEDRERLTEAFYMLDPARSRSRHGIGLGLTLCAEILALHGSTLEISSTPGKGTTVSFEIGCDIK